MSSRVPDERAKDEACSGTTQTLGHQVLGTLDALVVREPKPAAQQRGDVDAIRSETATSALQTRGVALPRTRSAVLQN
jgi:hypothetical protein